MAKALNFNSTKKQFFTVTLPDKKKTTLMICTPTKAILREFMAMSKIDYASELQDQAVDDLYKICAILMSRNKAGTEITPEQLEDLLDFEDILIFIKSYSAFIKEVTNQKN